MSDGIEIREKAKQMVYSVDSQQRDAVSPSLESREGEPRPECLGSVLASTKVS